MNRTAEACNSAYTLVKDGHVERGDLHDTSVRDAREILTRASANMKRLDAMGKQGGQTYPRHPAFFAGIFLRSVRPLPPRCVPREFCR